MHNTVIDSNAFENMLGASYEKNALTESAIAINVAWRQKISRESDNFDLRRP